MRVYVYWNLHKDCYSIMALEGGQKGRVIGYAESVVLSEVTFTVSEAMRLKCLTGKKRVHAGMRGNLISTLPVTADGLRAITYNPRKHATFIYRDNLQPIHDAARVVALSTSDKRADCYAT